MKNISDKNCTENQNTYFMFNTFYHPRKSYRLWDNVEKYCIERVRPQMTIWRMRIACWIPRATNTHSGYIMLIAPPVQQWSHNGPHCYVVSTRWFKYDRDICGLFTQKSVPVIFEPPCTLPIFLAALFSAERSHCR